MWLTFGESFTKLHQNYFLQKNSKKCANFTDFVYYFYFNLFLSIFQIWENRAKFSLAMQDTKQIAFSQN
jgi:hypothetical protein